MGSGEIGSNGSVHYTFKHDDAPGGPVHYKDADPIPYNQIGRGSNGSKGHPDHFAVRMRFPDVATAQNALSAAVAAAGAVPGGGGIYVTCLVPAVTPMRPSPHVNPYLEVKVDW